MRAIVRDIPDSFAHALAAVPPDSPIDVALARRQHAIYVAALRVCGVDVITLPADEASPDCVFIEDTAVIANGLALVTRPGAPSRQGEVEPIAAALAPYLEVVRMLAPATLDGGDCMKLGSTLYVGRSERTNVAGFARLAEVFIPRGLHIVAVDLPPGILHLKCVCTPLADDQVLLAEHSVLSSAFGGARVVTVPAEERYAANAVAIGSHVIVADGFPRTHTALLEAGFTIHPVPTSEVRKADGSLTCQSLLF